MSKKKNDVLPPVTPKPEDLPEPYKPHTLAVQTLEKLKKQTGLNSDQVIEALLIDTSKNIRARSLAGVVARIKQVRKGHGIR